MTMVASKSNNIGTHNGHFHADEALAVYMLRKLPAYHDFGLVRTRDQTVLDGCHVVVDVGGSYEPARFRFDHHQRGFDVCFPGRATKLSSAGLVYLHYGRELIAQHIGPAAETADVDLVWRTVYEDFVEALDAHDNGISQYDPEQLAAAGLEKRFKAGAVDLSAAVARRNPHWNEPRPDDPVEAQGCEDARFLEASTLIGDEFDRHVSGRVRSWLPALAIVRDAFHRRTVHDPAGRLLVLDRGGVPWKEHVFWLEANDATTAAASKVLYVLYPESTNPLLGGVSNPFPHPSIRL